MYQALYRKYRPRCFCDVAGQEHITETLRQQIIKNRLSHAYLFVGTRGTGKTTCAKILSRAVNCLEPVDGEPCNKCLSCIGIEEGSILDVLELDAASNNSVDNVRALRDEAIYSPAAVRKRVYIVDEVHMLSLSAFNALLKILEEPPEHILFILATTELHKVPETIQSRCQKFSFKRLSHATLCSVLGSIAEREGFDLTGGAADRLATLADGSMRDGISLLDQCASVDIIDFARVQNTLGLTGQQEMSRLIEMVADRDTISALGLLDELYNDGRDMASLLNEMSALIRDLLVFKVSPNSGLIQNVGFEKQVLSVLSDKMPPERLFFCLNVLTSAISVLPRGGGSKHTVEMCLFKMSDERLSNDLTAVDARVTRLEEYSGDVSRPKVEQSVNIKESPVVLPPESEIEIEEANSVVLTPEIEAEVESVNPVVEDTNTVISDDFWSEITALLRREPAVYALLSDSAKVKAKLQDGILIINVTDFFTASSIEAVIPLIKDAAVNVLGRDVIVRVEIVDEVEEDEDSSDGIDSLSVLGL